DGSDDRPVAASGTTLPPAALPFPSVAEPADAAETEPASEPGQLDHDPIPVEPREALSASAAPEPEPAPQAAPPSATESDGFLLPPLPPPGAAAAPTSTKPTDPLAPLRALTPHERIALFT